MVWGRNLVRRRGRQLRGRIGGWLWIRSHSWLGLNLLEVSWRRLVFTAGIVNFRFCCVDWGCGSGFRVAIDFSLKFEIMIRNLMFYSVLF